MPEENGTTDSQELQAVTINKRVKFEPEIHAHLSDFEKEYGVGIDEIVNASVASFINNPDFDFIRNAIQAKTANLLATLPD